MYVTNLASINTEKIKNIHNNSIKILLFFAIFSFFTTLFLPYIGEEGVYTISSLEMIWHKSYLVPKLLGHDYARPPLFNWLIIVFTKILGIKNILVASRLVTMLATVSICFGIVWFVKKIFNNHNLAYFAALIYIGGDVLIKRGWIAYADPLFSVFVFFNLACLYLFISDKKNHWLLLSSIFLIFAYLTKVYTAYFFFFGALFVLFCSSSKARALLLKRRSLFICIAVLLVPFLWNYLTAETTNIQENISGNSQAHEQLSDFFTQIKLNLRGFSFYSYCYKIACYPFRWFFAFLPASGVMLYYWFVMLKKINNTKNNSATNNSATNNSATNNSTTNNSATNNSTINNNTTKDNINVSCFKNLKIISILKNFFSIRFLHLLQGSFSTCKKYCANNKQVIIILAFAIVNCIPYWIIPQNPQTRYIMPVYPFFAIFIAYVLFNAGRKWIGVTLKLLTFLIIIRYLLGLFWFPYYYTKVLGNAKEIAIDIDKKAVNFYPLFVNDSAAKGIRIAAEIDVMRYPKKPVSVINFMTDEKHVNDPSFSEYVLVRDPKHHKVIAEYDIERSKVYLICFNKACGK